jgi:hypothetical protein
MANVKISGLPAASTLTGAELVPVVQSGVTSQTTLAAMPYVPSGTGAVTTTVQAKLRETVSVKDFGAVGDGVTDDTAAVQAAVDYCVLNNRDLSVPGLCLLTASININRQVNGVTYDNYFTIFTDSGGGFYVSTAIKLFSSSLTYTTTPITQCIKFQNLEFQASVNTLAAYVLDGNKFLRTQFNGCTFSRIRCLTTAQYTQSIYFFNCNVRRFSGIFYNCTNVCYDIKFMGNIVESGDQFALMGNATQGPTGCCFIGNLIEGMNNYGIQYGVATGLSITSNYFEANGIDIDGRTLGGTSVGVAVIGNFYSHSPTPNAYGVLWGPCSGSVSMGNGAYSNINNLLSTSQVQINDASQTANTSNYFAAPNSGYGESSWSPVFRGGNTSNYTYTVASAIFTKNGKQITLSFRGTMTSTATNSAETFYIPSLLPYSAFEAGNLVGSVQIVNAGGTVYDSQLIMPTTAAVQSTGTVIPSNVSGNVFTVRGYFTFYTNQVF